MYEEELNTNHFKPKQILIEINTFRLRRILRYKGDILCRIA